MTAVKFEQACGDGTVGLVWFRFVLQDEPRGRCDTFKQTLRSEAFLYRRLTAELFYRLHVAALHAPYKQTQE